MYTPAEMHDGFLLLQQSTAMKHLKSSHWTTPCFEKTIVHFYNCTRDPLVHGELRNEKMLYGLTRDRVCSFWQFRHRKIFSCDRVLGRPLTRVQTPN